MEHGTRPWLIATGAVLALLAAPYLLAAGAQPEGSVFSGFLLNPVDGFSYLAKMRQGAEGSWLFRLPYAADPGEGAALFLYYLGLGHLQRVLGWPPLVVYHVARLTSAAAMFVCAWVFLKATVPSARARGWSYALILVGSGLGWLGLPFGRLAVDLWVPEAIPFLAAFANPHFPLAASGMLAALTALAARGARLSVRVAAGAAAGLLLGIVQPFAVVTVGVVALGWMAWGRLRPRPAPRESGSGSSATAVLAAFLATSLPWIAYDLWVTRTHPALASWSAQNLTPTPPAVDVLLGLGLALPLALTGARGSRAHSTGDGRLLLAWLGLGFLLVFAPIDLQRRLLLGLFFPVAALAGIALERLAQHARSGARALAYVVFALCLPTNLILVTAALGAALRQEPEIVLSRSERASYAWASENLPPDSLVLSEETSGNRLPAFAPVRVVYGHPFETPDAEAERRWIMEAFSETAGDDRGLERLRSRGIDYVYVGPRERSLGVPSWLLELTPVYSSEGISIFARAAP